MKNAADWIVIAKRNIPVSPETGIFLHNLFLQVQADAFEQAAGLVDEELRAIDVKGPGILLRSTARGIWAGHGRQAPAPETVLAEGVIHANERVTHNLATGEVTREPLPPTV